MTTDHHYIVLEQWTEGEFRMECNCGAYSAALSTSYAEGRIMAAREIQAEHMQRPPEHPRCDCGRILPHAMCAVDESVSREEAY